MGARRRSREIALSWLFGAEFSTDTPLIENTESDKETIAYSEHLLNGVQAKKTEIDAIIEDYSKNWSINRMSFVDRNILRIATFEIRFMENEIPPKVAINEALDVAKKYSNQESVAFINGILDQMSKGL